MCSQVRGDRSRGLFDRYKIGYADLNGGVEGADFHAAPGQRWFGPSSVKYTLLKCPKKPFPFLLTDILWNGYKSVS